MSLCVRYASKTTRDFDDDFEIVPRSTGGGLGGSFSSGPPRYENTFGASKGRSNWDTDFPADGG